MNPIKKLIFIAVITLICLYISLPNEIPVKLSLGNFRFEKTLIRPGLNLNYGRFQINRNFNLALGLDLAGGSHLVFEADLQNISEDKRSDAINSAKNIIERRVNLFGISEPNVQSSSFEGKSRIIVELPGISDTQIAVGLIGQTAKLIFAEVGGEGENQVIIPTDLSGADLKNSTVVFDQNTGNPSVSLQFTAEGGKKFSEITGRNIGKALPILLDDEIISAPIVQDKITGDSAVITGTFSLDQAKNLSIQLNAGALPVPIQLVEERTVGATLGNESVQASVQAGLIGLIMVCIFMIAIYGKLGVIAGIALIIFGVITLALYKLIPVVLTLPGIAGFLLSVGMAVDANILIFERFKEERVKRPIQDALEVSFGRAWDSIRDANIATLVTAFILANPMDFSFLHTSGPVRGFAITLALGILVSLFTGIIVSRNLLRVLIKEVKK